MFVYRWAHQLETDPRMQFRFHRNMTIMWLVLLVLVPFVPPFHFIHIARDQYSSHLFFDSQIFASLLILEISLWANAFTHFGALSAALAAIHTDMNKENSTDTHDPRGTSEEDPNAHVFEDYEEASDWLFDEEKEELPTPGDLINAVDTPSGIVPLEEFDPSEIPHNLNP